MNARKRDRNTTTDDDIHDQTNKLQRTSSFSLTTINTHRLVLLRKIFILFNIIFLDMKMFNHLFRRSCQ